MEKAEVTTLKEKRLTVGKDCERNKTKMAPTIGAIPLAYSTSTNSTLPFPHHTFRRAILERCSPR